MLAAVAAGLVIGSRLGTILTPNSRVLWLSTWKMVGFVLNGFVFVLIGLELPAIVEGLGAAHRRSSSSGSSSSSAAVVVIARLGWVFVCGQPPAGVAAAGRSRGATRGSPGGSRSSWAGPGSAGAVSLAAALALPADFPERNLILLLTFAVILVTLVGQGLTLPLVVRWAGWDGTEPEGDEATFARERPPTRPGSTRSSESSRLAGPSAALRPARVGPARSDRPPRDRGPRRDRGTAAGATSSTRRSSGASSPPSERQSSSCATGGEINDQTLRTIERELDLEELRMEG